LLDFLYSHLFTRLCTAAAFASSSIPPAFITPAKAARASSFLALSCSFFNASCAFFTASVAIVVARPSITPMFRAACFATFVAWSAWFL